MLGASFLGQAGAFQEGKGLNNGQGCGGVMGKAVGGGPGSIRRKSQAGMVIVTIQNMV